MTKQIPFVLIVTTGLSLPAGQAYAQAPPAGGNPTSQALTAFRDQRRAELAAAETEYSEFRGKNPFVIWRTSIYAERLAWLERRRKELTERSKVLSDLLSRTEAAVRAAERSNPRARTAALESKLAPLLAERFQALVQYAENHPAVLRIDAAIAEAKGAYEAEARLGWAVGLDSGNMEAFLRTVRAVLDDYQTRIAALSGLWETESKVASNMAAFEAEEKQLRERVASLRKILGDLEKIVPGRP